MSIENTIFYIRYQDILNKDILINNIYNNLENNYYFTDDFSKEFYIDLCSLGFISTSIINEQKLYLLPEIQYEYALLYFDNLHISKKVKKLLNKNSFDFNINKDIEVVFKYLDKYHNPNWLVKEYKNLIKDLYYNPIKDSFSIKTFLVTDSKTKEPIAGEIGYKIGKTYTSLTGFSSKDRRYRDYGKLQLILTAKYLQDNSYMFWNLGHPYMQYKFDIGAIKYSRKEFLEKWFNAIK
ncbi:MAG: hypothetical protein ACQERD_06335 [Campylobacterota bacterium]